MKPHGNGKGGTYFGATGCGKSYTMLYLTRLLMRDEELQSPTIILITDRTDLDDQLSKSFVKAKEFIGENNMISVESRADLREKLQDEMLYIAHHSSESSFHLIGHLYLFFDYLTQSTQSTKLVKSSTHVAYTAQLRSCFSS